MSDETKPNFMRYQRVAGVIATEPVLKARMGSKTEVVLKPNGDKVAFPKEVIDVTERIHAIGHDAVSYSKDKIVQLAIDVILYGGNGSAAALPKKIEPAVPKQRRKRRKVAVQKPVVQKPVVQKVVAPQVVVPELKKPRKKRQSSGKIEVSEPAVAAEAAKPKVEPAAPADKKAPVEQPARSKLPLAPVMVAVASPPVQAQGSVVPFAVGCAVNSNLICASQLLEVHDRTLEGKEIKERLDKIIDEINRRTVIPSASRG